MKRIICLILFLLSVLYFTSVFTTYASGATLSNIQPSALTPNSATISWTSSTNQDSKVEYGGSTSYGSSQTDATSVTNHSIVLSSLTSGTTYHFRVENIAGDTQSLDFTFTTPYDFGVITNSSSSSVDTSHIGDEYNKGIRLKTIELAWDQYEPTNGTWGSSYINAKKAEIVTYQAQGFQVILDLGIHYTPTWVTAIDANALFKNQWGDTYAPGSPGKNIANVVFDNSVRTVENTYISRVFTDLGTNFYSVRAGGLWYGELHYPSGIYNGRTNGFWGYDANAQGSSNNLPAGVNVNPVPGWVPNPVNNGTFENGNDGNWALGGTSSIVSSGAHRGANALQEANPGSFINQTIQDVPVVAGRTYRYSFWGKTTSSGTTTPACLQIRTTGDAEIVSPQCAYSNSWVQVTGTFTPNVNTVRMALLTYQSESGVVLSFDDVSIMDSGYSYDATNANATSFWNWYRDSLTNYQNWQVTTYRNAGYTGRIFMLYPGYGIRTAANTNWVTDSESYDLSYTKVGNTGDNLEQGVDWGTQIAALSGSDSNLFAYSTWIDGTGTDGSSDKNDWSPSKYLAYVANLNSRKLYGENTGSGNYAVMQTAVNNMVNNNYSGMFWFDESQLYGGTYATADNYRTQIETKDTSSPFNATVTINSNAVSTSSTDVTLSLSATDNVSSQSAIQMEVSNASDFSGASYQPFMSSLPWSLTSGEGHKTVYARFKDESGNISNTVQSSITYALPIPTSAASSNSSGGSSSSDPNNHSNWSYTVQAGPSYVGAPQFIHGDGDAMDAMILIANDAHHDDVHINVKKLNLWDLMSFAIKVPFPWMQGFNTVSDMYSYSAFAAFNGYPVTQFDKPVTIVLPYNPAQLNHHTPAQLRIAYFDTKAKHWKVLPTKNIVNTTAKTIANTTKTLGYFTVVYPR